MVKWLYFLCFVFSLCFGPAHSQTACNSPSGFLKSFGPSTTGDVMVLGPDCEHLQDLGVAVGGVVTTRLQALSTNFTNVAGFISLGYSTPGDGGGAIFKNVGNAPFIDSQVNSVSIGGVGTGCTPGTYLGVYALGGSGNGLQVNLTIGGGGTLTVANTTGTGGGGYTVGNVLTFGAGSPAILGCSVQPTITVAGVTTPLASFTDLFGNHFQIVSANGAAIANIRQFGAIQNYVRANGDAAAQNDGPYIQACLRYVSVGSGFTDAGGYSGGICIVPSGASLVCNGLQVSANARLQGTTRAGSMLKQCDSDNINSLNFITLGDPQSHLNAFDATLKDLTLFGGGSSPGTAFMVYSNSSQSANALDNVAIYSVARGCIKYELGYGGPSAFGVHGGLCVPNNGLSPSPAINLSGNFSFTFDNGWALSVGGAKWAGTGILLGNGGTFQMNSGAHFENLTIGVEYDGTVGSPMMVSIISAVGGAAIDRFISIKNGSVAGVNLQGFSSNGTVCNVFKEPATCSSTGNIGGLASF